MYFIENNLTRLKNGNHTFFLDPKELKHLTSKLKKNEYNIYYPYKDSEKNIVYKKEIPKVVLYEIKITIPVRHQDILGSLYSLNISSGYFGDILIINNHYYVYILDMIKPYFETNFTMVKNAHIKLIEHDLDYLKDYKRNYEKIELIVSSTRIDTVISSICHTSRKNIETMIKKKEIILNYDFLKNDSYKLKDNDTFSIKKIGKFKFNKVLKTTKSNHIIIEVLKYI
ncbi:MAG: hypothetical protein IK997_03395 [Bacilli bacterium]|nr:hypothetical protein [Bacilli bacterium]